ncbi:MAG: Sua5/YciO/YrdC/YwlC family protein [Lysobacterales bacterium]|jgi:L-threonylcarbamoyladenylate synthase
MATQSLLDITGAVTQLRNGEVIAYPTEAVYGLGCDPRNDAAIGKLLTLKGRPASAGFVLIASGYQQLAPWLGDVDEAARAKAMRTWPGPVTWLFPRGPGVSDLVAGEHDTVAVRITAHETCRALCEAFGSALISTSANHRAAAPARSVGEVEDYFGDCLGGILAGALGGARKPSEIRDLASGDIVRPG